MSEPRRHRSRSTRCIREGCGRYAGANGYRACSFVCNVVHEELERAQRVCEATGDGSHWAAAVALNDALTDYYKSDQRMHRAAMESGFSRKQWAAVKRGG